MIPTAKSLWDEDVQVEEVKTKVNPPQRTSAALWRPCLIGLSLGLVIAGIGLAVIVVLYIQGNETVIQCASFM